MFKVIALMGKAGSGKDALLHELIRQCPDANCASSEMRQNGGFLSVSVVFVLIVSLSQPLVDREGYFLFDTV